VDAIALDGAEAATVGAQPIIQDDLVCLHCLPSAGVQNI